MIRLIPIILLGALLAFCSFDLAQETHMGDDGKELYLTYCKSCHGKKGGLGIGGAAKLTKSNMELEERISVIKDGKGKMAPFGAILSKKEIKSIAKFTMTLSNE